MVTSINTSRPMPADRLAAPLLRHVRVNDVVISATIIMTQKTMGKKNSELNLLMRGRPDKPGMD